MTPKGMMLVVVALACLLVGVRQPVNVYDEGYILYGAIRILTGEIPYRDFWLVYAPAQFYVVAGLFKAWGASVLLARGYDTLVRLAIVVLVYRLACGLTRPWVAMVPAASVALLLATAGFYGYPMFPALALMLASVSCLFAYFATRAPIRLFAAGLLLGGATVFRHDVGGAGLVAEALALAAFASKSPATGSHPLGRLWRVLNPLASGIALVVVPVAALLLWTVPISELWWDLFVFPVTVLKEQRALPYPGLPYPDVTRATVDEFLVFYVPLAVFGASLATLAARFRIWETLTLTLLGIGLFRLGINRADLVHLLPGTVIALVLGTALLFRLGAAKPPWFSAGLIALAAVVGGDPYIVQPAQILFSLGQQYLRPQRPSTLAASAGISGIEDQEAAIRYVQQHTATHERVLVGNSRHDRTFLNDIAFYFLAGRGSATRYHHLEPGVVTTRPVQQEIMAVLEDRKTPLIVRFAKFENHLEPNGSSRSSGVTDLDAYIGTHYRLTERFGDYTIWTRVAP